MSEIATQYPVCVLTGTREVGKTSLLTHSFPQLAYASLDVPYDAERAEEQSGLFLEQLASPAELQRSVQLGAIFETHTFGQLVRAYTNRGLRYAIYFFRTHDGEEVDFVIQSGSEFVLIECKWSEQPSLSWRGYEAFERVMPQSIRGLSLISSQRQDLCKDRDRGFWIRSSIDWDFLFER